MLARARTPVPVLPADGPAAPSDPNLPRPRETGSVRTADQASGGALVPVARPGWRRQQRRQLRPRLVALIAVAAVVLGALPLYLLVQAATRDPVFAALDALPLPAGVADQPRDTSFGSRWCIIDCRFRERDLVSEQPWQQTAAVYEAALRDSGWWSWRVEQCPDGSVPGHYTCWRRDEYTLDLWVRDPQCALDPLHLRPTVGPTGARPDDKCTGSVVSIKVRNRIDDERGRGPLPGDDSRLTGETPDPAFSDVPVPGTTPTR